MPFSAHNTTETPQDNSDSFYSVTVDLQGRMMRQDYSEQKCVIQRMSPAVASFSAANLPNSGERVIAYVEQLGRIEGSVTRTTKDGFEVAIHATPRKQSKLAAQLTWLANKHELGVSEDRRHERTTPSNDNAEIRLEDGRTYPCHILDLSVSGAAFVVDIRPEVGTKLWLGSMQGRVVRHFDNGLSMEFTHVQPLNELEERLKG
ncbi:PilZ domain-containing protein [Lentilitoribacter sp. EG35]|jgi:hypothetical protein|uniref:PilZ domain-containing protein n=1 Tax=Lentilitoribacter sp. EG35 TaxID=3234192 RepID=UPI00345F3613